MGGTELAFADSDDDSDDSFMGGSYAKGAVNGTKCQGPRPLELPTEVS